MPDVTIITAARLDTADKVRWLRELAESILRQSKEEWEWVVVDDASPTVADLPSDVRIRLVRAHGHCGTAKCRNTAAALARTPCILPVDADDLLAGTDTLEVLYEAWKEHQDHFVYGDIQLLADGQPGRVIQFPEYDFPKSLDPKGIVHVSAMHSLECWHKAGGWKPSLDWGLEDVEYWISAGAAGFCGLHLSHTALVYRKHPQSRTRKMRSGLKQRDMEQAIQAMHPDLYAGRYPMGCCGGSRSKPLPQSVTARGASVTQPRMLAGPDRPGGKVWVRYEGNAGAAFEVRGRVSGDKYQVHGHGFKFQIWAQDATFFASLGRGKHFSVGVPPPELVAPEPEPEPEPQGPEYQAPEPELAVIERLDPVGAATREMVPGTEPGTEPELEPEPGTWPAIPDELLEQAKDEQMAEFVSVQGPSTGLAELDLDTEALRTQERTPLDAMTSLNDQMKAMLGAEGWTLEGLAQAQVEELIPYPGIGKVTAARAIAEANRLWER